MRIHNKILSIVNNFIRINLILDKLYKNIIHNYNYMRIKYFSTFKYTSPNMCGANVKPFECSYELPYIDITENRWRSNIVEWITITLWSVPIYLLWFPLCFCAESLYMLPLHIYKTIYVALNYLDNYLY